jgi:hypothetical protein
LYRRGNTTKERDKTASGFIGLGADEACEESFIILHL